MGDVISFSAKDRIGDPDFPGIPELAPFQGDGGKARILRKHDNFKFRSFGLPVRDVADDLRMDHADPAADTAPCEYVAPAWDGA